MKKLITFVFVLIACFTIVAETYRITDITGSNSGKGIVKGSDGTFLKIGQILTEDDKIVLPEGSEVYLNNNFKISKSGTVKDNIEKIKIKRASLNKKIKSSVNSKSSPISTASSRASEAKSDFEWEE